MNKIKILILLATVALFSSCTVAMGGSVPYGIWESEDPKIILNVNSENEYEPKKSPDSENRWFTGTYTVDGESFEIVYGFSWTDRRFYIYKTDEFQNSASDTYKKALFAGTYSVRNDKIYYKVLPYWKEKSGYKKIVFEKVSDYEEDKKT